MDRNWEHLKREGGSLLQAYWTFGRYDAVVILEAPNEMMALKTLMRGGDHLSIETLLAIPRAEAVKLLDQRSRTSTLVLPHPSFSIVKG